MNNYGYQLLGQKKTDEAIEIFRKNVKDHPGVLERLRQPRRGLRDEGDKKPAIENYAKALSMAPETQKKRINDALARLRA